MSILVSLKFTVLLLVAIFALIAFLYLWRNNKLTFKFLWPYFFVGLVIFPITSINPYYTNVKEGKHVFYPAFGKDKVTNLLSMHVQYDFYKKNRLEKLFISTFSHTGDSKKVENYKIPFTFKLSEISIIYNTTIPYGGFGAFFGGIVLLSIVLLLFSVKSLHKIPSYYSYIFIGLIINIFAFPDSWLARMVPQIYLLPILIVFVIDTYCTQNKLRSVGVNFNLVAICINTLLFIAVSFSLNYYFSLKVSYRIKQLKELEKGTVVEVDYMYKSNLKRFEEYKIPYKIKKISFDMENKDLYTFGMKTPKGTRFIAKLVENEENKGFVLKTLDQFYGKIETKYYPSHKK